MKLFCVDRAAAELHLSSRGCVWDWTVSPKIARPGLACTENPKDKKHKRSRQSASLKVKRCEGLFMCVGPHAKSTGTFYKPSHYEVIAMCQMMTVVRLPTSVPASFFGNKLQNFLIVMWKGGKRKKTKSQNKVSCFRLFLLRSLFMSSIHPRLHCTDNLELK